MSFSDNGEREISDRCSWARVNGFTANIWICFVRMCCGCGRTRIAPKRIRRCEINSSKMRKWTWAAYSHCSRLARYSTRRCRSWTWSTCWRSRSSHEERAGRTWDTSLRDEQRGQRAFCSNRTSQASILQTRRLFSELHIMKKSTAHVRRMLLVHGDR